MRIHIATDHAGLDFSTQLQDHLRAAGHEVVDHGPIEYDAVDDYPAFCIRAAQAVVADQRAGVDALGVVTVDGLGGVALGVGAEFGGERELGTYAVEAEVAGNQPLQRHQPRLIQAERRASWPVSRILFRTAAG